MQFLFNEVFLPNKGLVSNSLKHVYGIGLQRANYLLSYTGVNRNLSIKTLSKYKYLCISSVIRKNLLVDSSFRRIKFSLGKKLLSLKNYRAVKTKLFLPVRGQSTRTNARTSKKRRSSK